MLFYPLFVCHFYAFLQSLIYLVVLFFFPDPRPFLIPCCCFMVQGNLLFFSAPVPVSIFSLVSAGGWALPQPTESTSAAQTHCLQPDASTQPDSSSASPSPKSGCSQLASSCSHFLALYSYPGSSPSCASSATRPFQSVVPLQVQHVMLVGHSWPTLACSGHV